MTLLETIDCVSNALDKKRTTVGVFIDLSKAFDTVDRTILLNILNYYGIKGLALEWFKNYLSDRLQSYYNLFSMKYLFSPLDVVSHYTSAAHSADGAC